MRYLVIALLVLLGPGALLQLWARRLSQSVGKRGAAAAIKLSVPVGLLISSVVAVISAAHASHVALQNSPEDHATVVAAELSEVANCFAFFWLSALGLLVLAFGTIAVSRAWRR
jgi:hypothetical protein